jgi:outer membrane protein W
MKKIILVATVALLLLAGTATADSIAGKFGVTARGGASYIFISEFVDAFGPPDKDIKPETGWTGGLGIMYGITDNLSVDFDVIYLQTNLNYFSPSYGRTSTLGTAKTIDFSLGAQWRFMPKSRFVPYVGAGFDVLLNKIAASDELIAINLPGIELDAATTYGAHLSGGCDFFITPRIALNAEIRGLYSTKGDITFKPSGGPDFVAAKYNPTNISGFLGIRFFFP